MRIKRETALKIIMVLCIISLFSVMALAVVLKSEELTHPVNTGVVIQTHIIINQSEQTCVAQPYRDPNEFHRIYYNAYAQFMGTQY
jgi:hypothetical protein